jgi:hypothetical protein
VEFARLTRRWKILHNHVLAAIGRPEITFLGVVAVVVLLLIAGLLALIFYKS